MSNQESPSVLTELETTLSGPAPTGTTHVLTVKVVEVEAGTFQGTISDPSLRLHNGDAVIWRFDGLTGSIPLFTATFPGDTLLSPALPVRNTFKLRIDVSEEGGLKEEVTAPYSLEIGGHTIIFSSSLLGLDPITPQLVIDNMGGMLTET